jgi:hypothetical protein
LIWRGGIAKAFVAADVRHVTWWALKIGGRTTKKSGSGRTHSLKHSIKFYDDRSFRRLAQAGKKPTRSAAAVSNKR